MSKQDIFGAYNTLYRIELIPLQLDIRVFTGELHPASVKASWPYRTKALIIVIKQRGTPRLILKQPIAEAFAYLFRLLLNQQSLRFVYPSGQLFGFIRIICLINYQLTRVEHSFNYLKGIHLRRAVCHLSTSELRKMLFAPDDVMICRANIVHLYSGSAG